MADKKISEMIDGGVVQTTDQIPVERGGDNYRVVVREGATLNTGNSIGDLLKIESVSGNPGLPALDGSNLYNLTALTGGVDSVNGINPDSSGNVDINADNIDDTTTTNKFVTASDLTKLSNLSGTNTGDQTTSGTANRITVTSGTTNPVIDIAATYVGQASITTVGTITTGSWQANPVGDSYISSSSTWNAKLDNITGLVSAGTNVSITGSGTSGSPYVINASSASLALNDLTDVTITSPTVNDTIVFNGTSWTNSIIPVLNVVLDEFVGDGSEDTFQLTSSPPDEDHIFVFVSGVSQIPGVDFTLSSSDEIVFTIPPANGVSIQSRSVYGAATGGGGGGGSGTVTSVNITAPAAGITASGGPITTSGSITLSLADDLAAVEALSGTGISTRTAANTWATRSIAGTTNRITITNGNGVSGNPTVDISTSYAGQSTITTVGTITTGVWNGTVIGDSYISSAATWNAKISNITGLVSAGSGISISGSGTSGSPYVVSTSGGAAVTGPGSSTDNTITRWNGTGGNSIQGSGIVISDNDEIYNYKALFNDQSGTSYTLQASDAGKPITLTNGSSITLNLPSSLPKGFSCEIIQGSTGQVTFSPQSGATLQNRQSHNRIAGQYGAARLFVVSNIGGTSAVYNLAGDTA